MYLTQRVCYSLSITESAGRSFKEIDPSQVVVSLQHWAQVVVVSIVDQGYTEHSLGTLQQYKNRDKEARRGAACNKLGAHLLDFEDANNWVRVQEILLLLSRGYILTVGKSRWLQKAVLLRTDNGWWTHELLVSCLAFLPVLLLVCSLLADSCFFLQFSSVSPWCSAGPLVACFTLCRHKENAIYWKLILQRFDCSFLLTEGLLLLQSRN